MLVFEILKGKPCPCEIAPSEDEIKAIQLDNKIKKRPKARNMLFTVMPGNDASEPTF